LVNPPNGCLLDCSFNNIVETLDDKKRKDFPNTNVNSNQSFEKSRFNVCENFCKIQKKSSFAKDLITSTHPKFHAMFVNGQPKTQDPNENKVAQK